MPHPDPDDSLTMLMGIRKRVFQQLPTPEPALLGEFGEFVDSWIAKNLTPLAVDEDVSFETWIDTRSGYPEWRKKELRSVWEHCSGVWQKKFSKVKAFQKDECYPEFKHARGIYSRSDEAKCFFGPIFSRIEAKVYAHQAFIKHVPVALRPAYIMGLLNISGARLAATDYTSFECSFTKQIMESCELRLYEFMTRHLTGGKAWMAMVRDVLTGTNSISFKWCDVSVDATRMSGEMCTSLGNGFTNLMLMLFACHKSNIPEPAGVVEGDDGLMAILGTLDETIFGRLGFKLKLEWHDRVSTASFCGMRFDPEDQLTITDPVKVVAALGWTSGKYAEAKQNKRMALLRSKGLSMAYAYPQCPVIQSVARYVLRVTKSFDAKTLLADRSMSMWDRQKLEEVLSVPELTLRKNVMGEVPMNTRLLMEEVYNIPVPVQHAIESYFDSLQVVGPISPPMMDLLVPKDWFIYNSRFVQSTVGALPTTCF
jgi:hypothetical protein